MSYSEKSTGNTAEKKTHKKRVSIKEKIYELVMRGFSDQEIYSRLMFLEMISLGNRGEAKSLIKKIREEINRENSVTDKNEDGR